MGIYEAINGFKLILEGACAMRDQAPNKKLVVSIIELVAQEVDIKRHSYIIVPLNFEGIGNGYYAYVFIEAATSGYYGAGPDVQSSIQKSIDDHIPKVRQKVINVESVSSFKGLFYEQEPAIDVWFPCFKIPIGDRQYDERFVDP